MSRFPERTLAWLLHPALSTPGGRPRMPGAANCRQGWGTLRWPGPVLGLFLVVGMLAGTCRAIDLTSLGWVLQRGAPSKTITAILQTSSGYLWIGTYDGLVRYDGVDFVPMDRSTRSRWHDDGVTCLYQAPNGVLWIGHSRGGVSSYSNGTVTYHPPPASERFDKIQALASDDRGRIWAMTSAGLLRCVDDGAEIPGSGPDRAQFLSMARPREGHIWLTRAYHLYELAGGRLSVVPWTAGDPGQHRVQYVAPREEGGLWVVAENVLYIRKPDGQVSRVTRLQMPFCAISSLTEVRGRFILIGSPDDGVLSINVANPEQQHWSCRQTGWATDSVMALAGDREGGAWLGSDGAGFFKLRVDAVSSVVAPDDWRGRSVLTVSPAHHGGFWIGTEGAGLYHLDKDGRWSNYSLEDGMQNAYVWTVYEDPKGTVWIGNWLGMDVLSDGRIHAAPGSGQLPAPINTIVPARDGGLWIGGVRGLVHYDNGRIRWMESRTAPTLLHVKSVLEDPDGTLWVGCDGEGLGCIRSGKVVRYTTRNGLSSDYIKGLYRDKDGVLWIGTKGGGLDRLKDGRFSAILPANGLADATVSQIEDDGRGYLWMSTGAGIIRASKRQLNACADGLLGQVDCLSYGRNDGLGSLICSPSQQGGNCRTADGRLVFSMDQSLAIIDPSDVALNTQVPPVVIESVRIDGRVVTTSGAVRRPVIVPPGRHRIEFKFTGLSFADPSLVRFKYRLDGLDSGWQQARAERYAIYSYVPPGHYTFRVLAANNDNVWNLGGAKVALTVRPFVWQTLWFRLTLSGLFVLATGTLVWNRARVKLLRSLERLELERSVDSERARIANDMHDEFGAHLTRITMLCETVRRDLGDPVKTRDGLGRIYETARGVTKAMDEIVWAVNPKHDTLESLVNYFEKYAQDFLKAAGIRCRFDFPNEIPPWRPHSDARHNLFLAYKEALNNAVKHSGGTEVTISLEVGAEGGRLVVADNGAGGAAASAAQDGRIASGNGLASMRRRLAQLGGSVELRQSQGSGFTVVFSFPWKTLNR